MPHSQTLAVGDRVMVPWGLDLLEGVVVRTYRTASGARAVVSVDIPGTDDQIEPRTVTLPVAELRRVDDGDDTPTPGAWVDEYQYTKTVEDALARVASRLPISTELRTEARNRNLQADALLRLGDRLIAVETKRSDRDPDAIANQMSSLIDLIKQHEPNSSVTGLLVLQSTPRADTIERLKRLGFVPVQWQGAGDDRKLASALRSLLGLLD